MFNLKTKALQITLCAKTDIGKERETNEDSVSSLMIDSQSFRGELNCGIIVVADGMGGREMGEVASDIATKKFIKVVVESLLHLSKYKDNINFEEILKRAIEIANTELWELSDNKSKPLGSTIVGALIVDNHIFVGNVGDSRAYLIEPSKKSIIQITKDHSVVQEMIDGQVITKEQARNHPRRNIITRGLGLEKKVTPDIFEADMKNKVLLLCSDGLSGMVDDKDIVKNINGNIYKSADALISLANKNGGVDNISVALASYNE